MLLNIDTRVLSKIKFINLKPKDDWGQKLDQDLTTWLKIKQRMLYIPSKLEKTIEATLKFIQLPLEQYECEIYARIGNWVWKGKATSFNVFHAQQSALCQMKLQLERITENSNDKVVEGYSELVTAA